MKQMFLIAVFFFEGIAFAAPQFDKISCEINRNKLVLSKIGTDEPTLKYNDVVQSQLTKVEVTEEAVTFYLDNPMASDVQRVDISIPEDLELGEVVSTGIRQVDSYDYGSFSVYDCVFSKN